MKEIKFGQLKQKINDKKDCVFVSGQLVTGDNKKEEKKVEKINKRK